MEQQIKKIIIGIFASATIALIFYGLFAPNLNRDLKNYVHNAIESGNVVRASVYVKNLSTDKEYGYKENEYYTPASILKVPLMMAYLKEAETKPEVLNLSATFTKEMAALVPNTFVYPRITDTMVIGKTYIVDELLTRLIKNSDNNAVTVLETYMPREQILSTISFLIGRDFSKNSELTPKEYSKVFGSLADPKTGYLNPEMSSKAIGMAINTNFNTGLVAGVEKGIVSHKYGINSNPSTTEFGINDCGLVIADTQYVICVMTTGNNIHDLEKVIRDISSIVYRDLLKVSE